MATEPPTAPPTVVVDDAVDASSKRDLVVKPDAPAPAVTGGADEDEYTVL